MARATYLQNSFLGGEWGPKAAHRIHDPNYKRALDTCLNAMPDANSEVWLRRPGLMYGCHTRKGLPARVISFDFNFSDPYNLILSDGYLRILKGLGPLLTDDQVIISSMNTATPLQITVTGNLPSGWADGDTVMLGLGGSPSTVPQLAGRQFTLQSVSTSTFTLYDSFTGEAVDGSSVAYSQPAGSLDQVYKIFELTTPWGSADNWNSVRAVQTPGVLTLFQGETQPQSLTLTNGAFELDAQSFSDGPYLDINTTTTTVTPSAETGSVTLTFSSTAGINDGAGFSNGDVGRLVRIQSAPAAWNSGTTYATAATVLGSDNNIYTSVIGGNTDHDPTTDDGTYWVLSGTTVVWSWAEITAITSTTVVTATIEGEDLTSTAATTQWQLGVYSNGTGWPTCGVYHEGRLWIAGLNSNRIDASVSNDPFNFAPTGSDGTVADANAISAVMNAADNNIIYWLLSTDRGILVGARSGEWLIRATQIGDPLSPSNIQWKQTSTYGCANIEPLKASNTQVFVQREARKLLDYYDYPYGEVAGWDATNLAKYTSHLTGSGIAEIRWQQEPSMNIWMRMNDGSLVGATFNHEADQANNFNAWHKHELGGGRTVTSISSGPTFDGLGTTLYAVLYDPTSGYYTVNGMAPVFDEGYQNYEAIFVDGIASPACSRELSTDNGDSINGLRISGLSVVDGQSVSVFLGGLDLGDYTVSTDHIDIPYTDTFTEAFLEGLDGSYGQYSLTVSPPSSVGFTSAFIMWYPYPDGQTTVLGWNADQKRGLLHAFLNDGSGGIGVWCVYDLVKGTLLRSATLLEVFGGYANDVVTDNFTQDPSIGYDGNLYCNTGNGNNNVLWKLDSTTLRVAGRFGTDNNTLTNSFSGFEHIDYGIGLRDADVSADVADGGQFGNYLIGKCEFGDIVVLNTGSMTGQGWAAAAKFGGGQTYVAKMNDTTAYVLGYTATTYTLSSLQIQAGKIVITQIGTIGLSSIDATWTTTPVSLATYFTADVTNNSLILVSNNSGAASSHKGYFMKVSTSNAALSNKREDDSATLEFSPKSFDPMSKRGVLRWALSGDPWKINTMLVADTTISSSSNLNGSILGFQDNVYIPEVDATVGILEWTVNSGDLTLIGTTPTGGNQLAMYGNTGPSIADVADWPAGQQFVVPASIGVTYTSEGRLLRPDTPDGGAANGPGFGKKKRNHKYSISVVTTQGLEIGSDFTTMDAVPMADDAGNVTSAPTLFTGVVTQNLQGEEDFDAQISWRATRPYPAIVAGIGGHIETNDG